MRCSNRSSMMAARATDWLKNDGSAKKTPLLLMRSAPYARGFRLLYPTSRIESGSR